MDALPRYTRFMAFHPCRTPDWRWLRAQSLVEHGKYITRHRDDKMTGHAVRYLRCCARSSTKVGKQFSAIQAAHRLFLDGGQTKLLVEARVLARQSVEEIAGLTSLPTEVVHSFESLFFDCRPYLKARDWIMAQAIKGHEVVKLAGPDRGAVLKSFAFAGGPKVLEAVLPYLLGNRDVFEFPLDLTTPEGRHELRTRLAVAAALLPRAAERGAKLAQIMLLMREFEGRRRIVTASSHVLAQNSKLLSVEGAFDAHSSEVCGLKTPSLALESGPAKQMAKVG